MNAASAERQGASGALTAVQANFRRLLNTRWQEARFVLVINHGVRCSGERCEELVAGVWSLNGQLFALDNITDIHCASNGDIVIAVERATP